MTSYFDTHAHFPADAAATAALLERAAAAGVTRIVAVGGSPELNRGARMAVAAAPDAVRLALGLDRGEAGDPGACAAAAAMFVDPALPPLVAVGEIGLDYQRVDSEGRRRQCALMEHQMEIAGKMRLPVIIHTREADDDTLAILRNAACLDWFRDGRPGVIHCFTGTQAMADSMLELGYCLSFSGIVTFANAGPLRNVARTVPEDRLLIETDTPYLTPVPLRGRPNEPAYLPHVAECLAKQRGVSTEMLAATTTATALRLFAPDE